VLLHNPIIEEITMLPVRALSHSRSVDNAVDVLNVWAALTILFGLDSWGAKWLVDSFKLSARGKVSAH